MFIFFNPSWAKQLAVYRTGGGIGTGFRGKDSGADKGNFLDMIIYHGRPRSGLLA